MSEIEIYEFLETVFNEIFNRRDIKLKPEFTVLDIPGWDSFKYIDIILAIEEKFSLVLQTEEIDALRNIGDLVRIVDQKIGNPALSFR